MGVEVGPQRNENDRLSIRFACRSEQVIDKGGPFIFRAAQGEQFFELVYDEQEPGRRRALQGLFDRKSQAARLVRQVVYQSRSGGERADALGQAGGQAFERVSGGGENMLENFGRKWQVWQAPGC